MQTDNGDVAKTGSACHNSLTGFVELAAQIVNAQGAILWIAGNESAGIAAATGIGMDRSDEGYEPLERSVADLDGMLDESAPGDRASGGRMAGRELAGQEILAGFPVIDPDGERLGSLWVLGQRELGRGDAGALESLERISGLIGPIWQAVRPRTGTWPPRAPKRSGRRGRSHGSCRRPTTTCANPSRPFTCSFTCCSPRSATRRNNRW